MIPEQRRHHPPLASTSTRRSRSLAGALAAVILAAISAHAAESLDTTRGLLIRGEYEKAAAAAKAGMQEAVEEADWPLLLARASAAVGKYSEARDVLAQAVEKFPTSLQLRLDYYHALRRMGDIEAAAAQLAELDRLGGGRAWAYRAPADQVALARVALMVGGDPKRVLEVFLDPVRKAQPEFREPYLASGELALEKNDFALAAKTFASAVKKFPEDPDAWFGLARAYAPSDSEAAVKALKKTLEFNPRHTGALLLLADQNIDAEAYAQADTALDEALRVDVLLPEAHAYRAVLGHLRSDEKAERDSRARALKSWPTNPAVPHLIGRKLSQKYRFAEGAALQREALKFDASFLPARAQLANDLLRLGNDEEGWKLVEEVQAADPYDVVAYNLATLRDAISGFQTLKSEHFLLRMDPREAGIYGADALALLERAHATLTKKYGLTLREKTIVEIFPDQKDFAIRTFGLPGGAGYLGVCFGRVITANSPASRPGSPSSWEAVLWHEFCHVVTLTATKNKMPRWLSEGISVYEERQARAERTNATGSWGEQMKPRYRAMILGEDLTPVSQLSAAFLKPKSAIHLGFAYYQSSLVVEWLTERWGIEKMKRVLADLGRGVEISTALATHFAPIEKLDAEFSDHAQALAKNTGPKLDWSKPAPAEVAGERAVKKLIAEKPDNYTALVEHARTLMRDREWLAAKKPLLRLIELFPNQHDADSAYSMLARVHRELGETDEEIAMLTRTADLAADATEAFARLMKLHAARAQWPRVLDFAARFAAVDPLQPEPHRFEAEALEATKRKPEAIAAFRTLLALGPADPAEVHYRLARLLHETGDAGARREILLALENAPRYREALALLLEITAKSAR